MGRRDVLFDELRRLEPLAARSDDDLRHLADLGLWVSLRPGTVLLQGRRPLRQGYIVLHGAAEVVIDGRRIARLGPGAVLGIDTGDVRAVDAVVRALSPMEVLVVGPYAAASLDLEAPGTGAASA